MVLAALKRSWSDVDGKELLRGMQLEERHGEKVFLQWPD